MLLVIGKSKNPKALKHCNKNLQIIPQVFFCLNDKRYFSEWFYEAFCPQVEVQLDALNLPHKAILFIDKAIVHMGEFISEDSGIKAIYLPPNTAELIQPKYQGVIASFKKNYRKK